MLVLALLAIPVLVAGVAWLLETATKSPSNDEP